MLELKNVGKRVGGETHIYPTDVIMEPGHFNILLGTTLSGKTTLLQLMGGLEKPTHGEVWFDGQNVTGWPVQRRNISMVYQQFINYPNMNVFDNIASPLKVGGLAASEIKRRVGEMAELLRISQLLDRQPGELSGGQQQRTAMARAMVKDSSLVLLDEPLANLDFKLREELRDELPKIFAERNCVVVYATTEPTEALLFGGKTVALHEGAVADFGSTSEIYRDPRNLTSAKVFSEPPINTAKVSKSGDNIVLNDRISWKSKNKGLVDGEYTMGLRPHHIMPGSAGKNSVEIPGKVKVAELSGSESMIHFDAFGEAWVSLSHGIHSYDSGADAVLHFDPANCYLFNPDGSLAAGQGG